MNKRFLFYSSSEFDRPYDGLTFVGEVRDNVISIAVAKCGKYDSKTKCNDPDSECDCHGFDYEEGKKIATERLDNNQLLTEFKLNPNLDKNFKFTGKDFKYICMNLTFLIWNNLNVVKLY